MNEEVLKTELGKILKMWQLQMNLEYANPSKNVRVSFGDIGSIGEMLAVNFNNGFIGGGSGGMGLDLVNFATKKSIEVKTCCTIQNAKCNSCGLKYNDLILEQCPNPDCLSTNSKSMNDSRFGINAKELLRQYQNNSLDKLVLCHISLLSNNKDNNEITIKLEWFDLDLTGESDLLEIRLDYFRNQANKGKNTTANLLPNSYDFYKLTPLKLHEITAKICYSDLSIEPELFENAGVLIPRVNEEDVRFYKKELPIFRSLDSYDPLTKSACTEEFTRKIDYREKSLGKDRGDTRAGVDNLLF